jgi:hypothetical protein
MSAVFASICIQGIFDKNDYTFLFTDGMSEVPMDEILGKLNVREFYIVKIVGNDESKGR